MLAAEGEIKLGQSQSHTTREQIACVCETRWACLRTDTAACVFWESDADRVVLKLAQTHRFFCVSNLITSYFGAELLHWSNHH